ncbi:MAG TPA: asparagine synthase-related protein, partial [Candidatus Dormibacteraeota bacterium]|nr:asparagine synthase-related protein [Candidatus Dormibacteraeota bacterium]
MRHDKGDGSAAWLAAFGESGAAPGQRHRELALLASPPDWTPTLAESPSCRVVFDGVLDNGDELRAQLAEPLAGEPTTAQLVCQAYGRWGEEAIARLKGIFALIVADPARDLLLCARDSLGIRPLFYAEVESTLLLSPAVETLLARPGVSAEINRACLVDRLTRHWPANDETYFTRVRRVPPGHVLRIHGGERRVYRYWNPLPADGAMEWIPDDEAPERFEVLFRQAVARCLGAGPAAIYMSGGLDSSTLAMVAADLGGARDLAPSCALSLVFSGTDRDEAARQRGLASRLGLSQVQLPFEDAVGGAGTLAAALEMTRGLPAPLALVWRPALQRLAMLGRERGCRVVLAGDGADEWLSPNAVMAADLLRSLDIAGLYQLWQLFAGSFHFSRRQALRIVLGHYGVGQLLPDAYYAAANRLGARTVMRQRWHSAAMRAAAAPPWVAPDPALRAAVTERLETSFIRAATGPRPESYYLRDARSRLDTADKWFREEETFLVGRRAGIPIREPFWDPDLIA